MVRFRSAVSLLLLAVLSAGGTLAPVVHRAFHAAEAARVEAQVAAHAADGHHHHTVEDQHGREILPPCPGPPDAHLTCVLCASASVSVWTESVALVAPEAEEVDWPGVSESAACQTAAEPGARGPPAIA